MGHFTRYKVGDQVIFRWDLSENKGRQDAWTVYSVIKNKLTTADIVPTNSAGHCNIITVSKHKIKRFIGW